MTAVVSPTVVRVVVTIKLWLLGGRGLFDWYTIVEYCVYVQRARARVLVHCNGTAGKFVGGVVHARGLVPGYRGGEGRARRCVCVRAGENDDEEWWWWWWWWWVEGGDTRGGRRGEEWRMVVVHTRCARVSEGEARDSAAAVYNSGSSVALATFRVQYLSFFFFFTFFFF